MEFRTIPNDKLDIDRIPSATASWPTISRFALTFDGYAAFDTEDSPQGCGDLANSRQASTLTELRASLFYEQRRWRHFGESPEALDLVYVQSLLWRIRRCVRRKLLD